MSRLTAHLTPGGTDLVTRSLEVIEAGHASGGAFIAGPSFSQYGYAWLRDGAFIAEALDLVGRLPSAARFHAWVARMVLSSAPGIERAIAAGMAGRAPRPEDYLHCRYTAEGTPGDQDWPTFQLDGPGIWLWSLAHHHACGARLSPESRKAARLVARYLASLWCTPCADAWEESPDHVHTSTLAAILAGLRAAHAVAPDDRAPEVRAAREAIERRLGGGAGPFTKWEGSEAVDASLLWMVAPYGLMPPEEPRFAATLERIERELVVPGGGVYRYREDSYYGGGEWPLLAAAYGRVLLRRDAPGDREHAHRLLAWIESQANAAGELPEQVATRPLAPDHVDEWRARWGESARPLLWSQAAYLALRMELERAAGTAAGPVG